MTPYQAGLAAIVADPFEKSNFLMLADVIEENGNQLRAAFIRNVCKGGGLAWWLSQIPDVDRKIADMFGLPWMAGQEWICESNTIDEFLQTDEASQWFVVRYGMIFRVTCPLKMWMERGPELVQTHPVLNVQLNDVHPRHHVVLNVYQIFRHTLPDRPSIPPEIFDLIPNAKGASAISYHPKDFGLCCQEIGQAALDWAKGACTSVDSGV